MRRSLGWFEVTCLGVNAIIGAGIFALPGELYRHMGAASPLAFVVCALGLGPVALAYAEAAGTTAETGGPYVYARDAFGASAGFVVGWMCFVNSVISFAAVAQVAASYVAGPLGGGTPTTSKLLALVLVALLAGLNLRGARLGARLTAALTVTKVAVLVLFVLAGAAVLFGLAGRFEPAAPGAALASRAALGAGSTDGLLAGLGPAVFLAAFALQGFEVTPVPAGETRDAARIVPRALVAAPLLSAVIYVLVQLVFVAVHPDPAGSGSAPLVEAARGLWPGLGRVVVAGGIISTLGFVAGNAFGTPRYAWAMARGGSLPAALGRIHARFETPHVAILATAAGSALLIAAFDPRGLMGMSNLAVAVQYLATCSAVLAFRRARRTTTFRAPGGPLIPAAGLAVSAWILTQGSRSELGVAAIALLIGLAVAAWRRGRPAPTPPC